MEEKKEAKDSEKFVKETLKKIENLYKKIIKIDEKLRDRQESVSFLLFFSLEDETLLK